MSSALTGRQVRMFRCQADPMLNAKAKLAHMCAPSDGIEAAELTPVGVYVKTTRGTEHLIPFANVQSIHLHEQAEEQVTRLKPGPKPKLA